MKTKPFRAAACSTILASRFVYKGRCSLNYVSRVIGVSHEQLKDFPDHEVWERVGYYLAQLAVNVFLMTSVEKIVIGGGLSHSPKLFGFVKMHFDRLINGYVKIPQHEQAYSHPILCEPALDDLNGLLGAVIAFGLN